MIRFRSNLLLRATLFATVAGTPLPAVLIHSCEDLSTAVVVDGAKLPRTRLTVNTNDAYVSEGHGSLHLESFSLAEDRVVYLSVDLRLKPVNLSDGILTFDAWTSDPVVTKAFYVRGYDSAGKCVLSWLSWGGLLHSQRRRFTLVPGSTAARLKWEPYMLQSPDLSAVSKLRFYVGTKLGSSRVDLYLDNVRVQEKADVTRNSIDPGGEEETMAVDVERFTDHGVGAEIAELRGYVATRTADGRNLVIATATDQGETGYILVTDVDSGETRQVFCPKGVRQQDPFGALLAGSGKFYHTQGKVLLEFDPVTMDWTFEGTPSKSVSVYLCFTEGLDGTVWAGGVYQTTLISFDPKTKELKDHGRMDPAEKYLQYLATDSAGWVYAAIGTARCNIVAYSPSTGEKRMLIPEEQRVHGSGYVHPTEDGAVYGKAAGQSYRLFEGIAHPIDKDKAGPRRAVRDIKYGGKVRDFPDGRRVLGYNLESRSIKVGRAGSQTAETITFEYKTEGAAITSLGAGPDLVVYGSTCHPMHFLSLDTKTNMLRDFGYIPQVGGGNFCAIACQGNQVIGAQYAGGCLWAYDVAKPWYSGKPRSTLAVPAHELIGQGRIDKGHLSYLASHEIVFVHGDEWGAEALFDLQAPAPGRYWLYIAPYQHHNYCTVQFLFDQEPVGTPYAATSKATQPGEVQAFGPLDLKVGKHQLTVRTTKTEGAEPFFGLRGVELTQKERKINTFSQQPNPRVLARWKRDICRPRTALAHSDGKHVMMAGFAGYGLCGGGIGIYDLDTGKETLLAADKDLLPGHSCITLKCLLNGDLVGGTSISAPGGGHSTAKEAELFILDWQTKKLTFHGVPVRGDASVVSLQVLNDGFVYGLSSSSTLFVFDPAARKVVSRCSLQHFGTVPRHALQVGPEGKLYAMLSDAILRVTPLTLKYDVLTATPVKVTAGGALVNGRLCFASGSHVWTYRLPDGE